MEKYGSWVGANNLKFNEYEKMRQNEMLNEDAIEEWLGIDSQGDNPGNIWRNKKLMKEE